MQDFSDALAALDRRRDEAQVYLRIDELRRIQPQLETEMGRPDLWDDVDAARKVQTELSAVNDDLDNFEELSAAISDAATLYEMAREESDESLEPEILESITAIEETLGKLEMRSLFSGEYDEMDAVCHIQSGEGGTDAQDWAEMLMRMYTRWAERKGMTIEIDAVSEGTEAGLSSVEFILRGRNAYGLMQSEHGVHRLVRISPFNKEAKRQTAFASMQVVPYFDDIADNIEIDEKDLRIDTYRSSGAGGQHVNVTDSAIRITHLPTGTVTQCQNERSQHQNKDRAMAMLAAKLLDLERQQRDADLAAIAGTAQNVGFGSQIRSYVLQPYQMVKDLRSEYEVGTVDAVLGGDIEQFMEAYLRWNRATNTEAAN